MTRSSWPAATSARSRGTSPSCSNRCWHRCRSDASSTARSSCPADDDRGLDFDALLQRIHPAESRVRRLAAETPASFVAFDLLALDDDSLLDRPLERAPPTADRAQLRRCRATDVPVPLRRPTLLSPSGGSPSSRAPVSTAWSPSGSAIRTRPTSARWSRSSTNARPTAWSPATASTRTATESARCCSACTTTRVICTTSAWSQSFTVKRRAELLAELEPLTHNALDNHPVARLGGVDGAGRGVGHAHARRRQSMERRQGSELGAVADRACRRGDVRSVAGRALPPRLAVRALATGPRARVVSLRPTRGGQPVASSPPWSAGSSELRRQSTARS